MSHVCKNKKHRNILPMCANCAEKNIVKLSGIPRPVIQEHIDAMFTSYEHVTAGATREVSYV